MGSSPSVDKARFSTKGTGSERNLLWVIAEHVRWQEQGRQLGILDKFETDTEKWEDLASQFVFINGLMEQMEALGVETHKLNLRIHEVTAKMHACKRPVGKLENEKILTLLKDRFGVALGANDNVRAACQWLKSHFLMGMKKAELEVIIAGQQTKLEDAQQGSQQFNWLDKSIRKNQHELSELIKCDQVHNRHLLGVNLHYLDRNLSGCIETSDLPNLPASIFNLCDKDMNHKISADELDSTVLSLEADLRDNTLAMQKLKVEQAKEQDELVELTAGLDMEDLKPAEQNKLEKLQVKRLKTEEMMRMLEQQQGILEDDKAAIYRAFAEEEGFVPDMIKKTDSIKSGDLIGDLRAILKEPEVKTARIGLAACDVQVLHEKGPEEAKQGDRKAAPLSVEAYKPGLLVGKAAAAPQVRKSEEKEEFEKEIEEFEEPISPIRTSPPREQSGLEKAAAVLAA